MSASDFRVCVVGTGSIGLRHLNVLKGMPGITALAAPKRPARVAELQTMGFTCIDAGGDLSRIDAAIIASDTSEHVTDALRFDCPVLIEKPMAIDAAASEPLRNRKHSAHVACVLRFNPGLAWVSEKLPELGRVQLVDAECLSWLPAWRPTQDYRASYSSRVDEGGVLRDLIHEIDYLHWLFGPAASVSASVWNSGQLGLSPQLEESCTAAIHTCAGTRITLRLSFAVQPSSRRLRIWGERGQLTWDALGRRASLISIQGEEIDSKSWTDPAQMYTEQLAGWIRLVREKVPSQVASFEDGLAALRVVDAIRQSQMQKKEISLP